MIGQISKRNLIWTKPVDSPFLDAKKRLSMKLNPGWVMDVFLNPTKKYHDDQHSFAYMLTKQVKHDEFILQREKR